MGVGGLDVSLEEGDDGGSLVDLVADLVEILLTHVLRLAPLIVSAERGQDKLRPREQQLDGDSRLVDGDGVSDDADDAVLRLVAGRDVLVGKDLVEEVTDGGLVITIEPGGPGLAGVACDGDFDHGCGLGMGWVWVKG